MVGILQQAIVDKTVELAEEIEWQEEAVPTKLQALQYFLTALSNRAHANLITPHDMRISLAHDYGF